MSFLFFSFVLIFSFLLFSLFFFLLLFFRFYFLFLHRIFHPKPRVTFLYFFKWFFYSLFLYFLFSFCFNIFPIFFFLLSFSSFFIFIIQSQGQLTCLVLTFFFIFLNVILTWVFARLSREFYLTYFRVDVGWMWMQGVDNPIGKLIGKEDGRERKRTRIKK